MRALGASVLAAVLIATVPPGATRAATPAKAIEDVEVGVNAKATKGRVAVYWTATCTGRIHRLTGVSSAIAPFSHSSKRPTHVGPYRAPALVTPPQEIETWFAARRRSAYGWTGIFQAKIRVFRGERAVAHCRVPRTKWSAVAPHARLSFAADLQYPFIGPNRKTYRLSMPRNPIWVGSDTHSLTVNFGEDFAGADSGLRVDITAPRRESLKVGRYRNDGRKPTDFSRPMIDFSGGLSHMGECLSSFGEFTIRALRFSGRNGIHLRTMRMSFVVRCGDQASRPIRGSFVYQR